MADIIEFGKKAENVKCERDMVFRQRKIEALRKFFQCTRCMVKCAKCGAQIDVPADERAKFAAPYTFCGSCQEEYQEYRDRAGSNEANSPCYWHNSNWMRVWESWLEHQKAVEAYRQSKEFLQLLDEVEHLLKK